MLFVVVGPTNKQHGSKPEGQINFRARYFMRPFGDSV
jgi:hypothetical protein